MNKFIFVQYQELYWKHDFSGLRSISERKKHFGIFHDFCFYSNMKAWLQILRMVPNSSIFFPRLGAYHNPKALFGRKWEIFSTYLPQWIPTNNSTFEKFDIIVLSFKIKLLITKIWKVLWLADSFEKIVKNLPQM